MPLLAAYSFCGQFFFRVQSANAMPSRMFAAIAFTHSENRPLGSAPESEVTRVVARWFEISPHLSAPELRIAPL
jgi:hypothetical protein